jgi:ADP-ribose pyrophosphatase YjhB (NUDIX family)
MPPPDRYNNGYNVGVGGAVVQDGRLLLVRRASRRGQGNSQIPGGFVEQPETMELAVVREVEEEAGVAIDVEGVLGIRNCYDEESGRCRHSASFRRKLLVARIGCRHSRTLDNLEIEQAHLVAPLLVVSSACASPTTFLNDSTVSAWWHPPQTGPKGSRHRRRRLAADAGGKRNQRWLLNPAW